MFSSQPSNNTQQLQLPPGQVENPTANTSKTNSDFEQTAAKLEGEYGSGDPAAAVRPEPAEPMPQIVSPEAMRKILAGVFNGLARAHGEHWKVSEADLDLIEPFNTSMVTEMVSKWDWLRDSEYKATIAWAAVMALFIGSRSKAGAQFLETMMDKIAGMFGRKEPSTKKDSQASPDSSPHQDTARPS